MEAVDLKQPHRDWLEARSIDPALAEKFGLRTERRGDRNWLAVPYVEQGKIVNHKYRVTSDKSAQMMDEGAPLTLWNHDVVIDPDLSSEPLIITEGEWDALAVLTIGKRRVVSVPNGAPKQANDDEALETGKRYAWFWRCEPQLRAVKQIILAVDGDEAGQALAADLCRLFGPERCFFVTYPELCKDPNDVSVHYGSAALLQMLDSAKPIPIKGLFKLSDFPEPGPIRTIPLGIDGLDELIPIVPATLTVLTGYPGQGKTTLSMVIIANLLRLNIPVCVGSFETMVKPIMQRRLRAHLLGIPEFSVPQGGFAEIDQLLEDNLSIIAQMVGEDDEMDIDELLERARVAIQRDGARVLFIDPWNEIEHKRRKDESETDYIGRALRSIKTFMRQYQVAVWIVAHPAKPSANTSANKVPGLADISGSMNWANKPDYGVVCSRPNKETNVSKVYVTKVKMGLPGREGSVELAYDHRISNFTRIAA